MRAVRAMRGGITLCAMLAFALLAPSAMAQVRHAGALPDGRGGIAPLTVGDMTGCGLRPDGTAQCWGYDGISRRATPPAGTFIELSAGSEHSCGVRTDGTLACWGREFSTSLGARPPTGRFTAVSSGVAFSCGVRAQAAVGPSASNVQCWDSRGGVTMMPLAGNFAAITTGSWHACGLLGTGEARCWKFDYGFDHGQANPPADRFVALTAGYAHTCGLRADGSVACWGLNDFGQAMAPADRFTAISAGNVHTCGLRGDGSVSCWGGDTFGQSSPPAETFVALDAGGTHTCGVRGDGRAICWGDAFDETPPPTDTVFGMGSVAIGTGHGCQVGADGQLTCWGYNPYGWNPPAGRFAEVGSGERYSCARQDNGSNQCWGWDNNSHGQRDIPPQALRQLDLGPMHGCAVALQGGAVCWGNDGNGQAMPPPGLFRTVGAGLVHSCGVRGDGQGTCWGYNGDGQGDVPALPVGRGYLSLQPGDRTSCGLDSAGAFACWGFAPAAPAGYFRAASTGGYHGCAIRDDGTVACVGENWTGQVDAPVGTFVSLSSGDNANCAIRNDGVRVCWGNVASDAPMFLEPHQLPAAGPGQAYAAQLSLQAMTGAPPLGTPAFRVVAGALPPGIALDAAGTLSGTPTTAGTFNVMIEGYGGNGFAIQKRYDVVIDDTPPAVAPQVTGTLGDNGWHVGTTQLAWSIVDNESSIAVTAGCPWLTLSSDQLARDYDCAVESAGGAASASVQLKVDVTAPATTLTANPGATSTSHDATFAFTGQDATAGVAGFECSLDGAPFASCGSPLAVTVAAGSHSFKVRAIDAAGLRDQTPVVHNWLVDPTPPTVTPSVNGLMGYNGWHVGDVQISWSVDDGGSAITSTTGCNTVTLVSDTPGASFTCTATSAGGTTSRTVTVKRDATAPVVTAAATTAANAAGWHKAGVSVAFACSDALSGGVACPAAQWLDAEGTSASTARTVTDAAGNSATSNVVTVRIDRTAPTLAPAVGSGTLLLNSTAVAAANGSDALSGIASQSCAALATASVGSKSVACTATDAAGNTAGASANYRVVYGFSGFSAPLQNPPVLNVLKSGRSASMRWRLLDAQGAPVSNLASAAVDVTAITCPSATENRLTTYGGSSGQLQNLGNGYYQVDWLAPSSYRNTCRRVNIGLGDGEAHLAQFKIN